jgi:GNAT superfamily N-acetyltransferase
MTTNIRPLRENEVAAAGRIIRVAFGTYLGVSDPESFRADTDLAGSRWPADPSSAFCAELDGQLVGSNFATRWGSVGFFGPLTVLPALWDKGLAKQLMQPIMSCFESWRVTHAGLYTFSQSPRHVALYQKYGFWPRFLTAIMLKPVEKATGTGNWSKYSDITENEQDAVLKACFELTSSIYDGLNVEREIRSVLKQKLGDTVLLWDDRGVAGLAVCHCGPGTEAGEGKCYIKFGAVRSGPVSALLFGRLLEACEALAASRGIARLEAGVSLARHEAYGMMLERGFRTEIQGVSMHRPNEPGYHRPGAYVIDDWR